MAKTKDIKNAIKSDIETISPANGYNTSVKEVSVKYVDVSNVNNKPFVCMMSGNSFVVENDDSATVTWELALVGYFHDNDLDTAIENFVDDVFTLFRNDNTNVESEVESLRIKEFNPDPFNEGDHGAVWIILEITYIK